MLEFKKKRQCEVVRNGAEMDFLNAISRGVGSVGGGDAAASDTARRRSLLFCFRPAGIGAVQHAFQFLHDRATSLRAAMRRQAQGVADEGAGA